MTFEGVEHPGSVRTVDDAALDAKKSQVLLSCENSINQFSQLFRRLEREGWVPEKLDLIVLGSPHFSLAEFKKLAPLLEGRRRHQDVQFLVTSSRLMAELADQAGCLAPLKRFGGKVTVDTCILTTPMLRQEINTLMTNSAKYAYYSPGLLNAQVVFGSLEDCVRSAIAGRVLRDESLWRE